MYVDLGNVRCREKKMSSVGKNLTPIFVSREVELDWIIEIEVYVQHDAKCIQGSDVNAKIFRTSDR
jgi:hypothetical protein